jgi:hypothetical protein
MPIKDALLPLGLAVAFNDVVIAWDHPLAWSINLPEMKDNFQDLHLGRPGHRDASRFIALGRRQPGN